MASCKDCVCSEVCYYKAFNDEKNLKKRRNDVEKICKSFVHRDRLKNAPTVDAVEVVHGRWVRLDAHKGIEQFKCSICRSECYVPTCMNEPMYGYCPNCGAKMDGDGDEN